MAVIDENEIQTPLEELQRLALAQSYFQMAECSAWKDLQARIQELVDKAQQEHFSSREIDPFKIIEEKLRWQQRLLTQQAIRTIVDSQLELRESILEEMKAEGEPE